MRRKDPDVHATRQAWLRIGWEIMLASAVLVLGIIAVAVVFVIHQAAPRETIDRTSSDSTHVYVDSIDLFQALVAIGIGAVVFAGIVSWFVARRAVTPLGTALRLQREFVADASHELRTPLAVLDARIQILERRLRSPKPPTTADATEIVTQLRADSRALVDIVNDLLLAAATESAENATPVPVASTVRDSVESLRVLAAEQDVTLDDASLDADVQVRIPQASLRRCVVALVDNAIAHSPANTTVRVAAVRAGSVVRLTVADEGHGIVGISPERIFERFAHTAGRDDGHTRQSFGIGLALVREIAARQGGRVTVESTSPAGTTMLLELPAAF